MRPAERGSEGASRLPEPDVTAETKKSVRRLSGGDAVAQLRTHTDVGSVPEIVARTNRDHDRDRDEKVHGRHRSAREDIKLEIEADDLAARRETNARSKMKS